MCNLVQFGFSLLFGLLVVFSQSSEHTITENFIFAHYVSRSRLNTPKSKRRTLKHWTTREQEHRDKQLNISVLNIFLSFCFLLFRKDNNVGERVSDPKKERKKSFSRSIWQPSSYAVWKMLNFMLENPGKMTGHTARMLGTGENMFFFCERVKMCSESRHWTHRSNDFIQSVFCWGFCVRAPSWIFRWAFFLAQLY